MLNNHFHISGAFVLSIFTHLFMKLLALLTLPHYTFFRMTYNYFCFTICATATDLVRIKCDIIDRHTHSPKEKKNHHLNSTQSIIGRKMSIKMNDYVFDFYNRHCPTVHLYECVECSHSSCIMHRYGSVRFCDQTKYQTFISICK